jgi:hypothetical protein
MYKEKARKLALAWAGAISISDLKTLTTRLMTHNERLEKRMTRSGAQSSLESVTLCRGHLLQQAKPLAPMRDLKRWGLKLFTVWPDK